MMFHFTISFFGKQVYVTDGEKISGSTGIRAPRFRNTVPELYHCATEPHVDLPHDISPNTYTRLHLFHSQNVIKLKGKKDRKKLIRAK